MATYNLNSTMLTNSIDASQNLIYVASTSSIQRGNYLVFADATGRKECAKVVEVAPGTGQLRVARGQFETSGQPHPSTAVIFIATAADQLFSVDPEKTDAPLALVEPWINLTNGKIWYLYGDVLDGQQYRWWQERTTAYGIGPLGIRTQTVTGAQS